MTIMVGKTPSKLLCIFEVKTLVNITYWPLLISELRVSGSFIDFLTLVDISARRYQNLFISANYTSYYA